MELKAYGKFLDIRNKVDFADTLNKHNQFKRYNGVVKNEGFIDDGTQKYIDMDMHVFMVKRNIKHTANNGEKKRFSFNTPYEIEDLVLFEKLVSHSELDVIKYLYLDYLVEFGDKKKKYQYAKELIETVKKFLDSDKHKEYDKVNVYSRYVDVVVSFKMKNEVKDLMELLIPHFQKLHQNEKYRWMLEYSEFIRLISMKFPAEAKLDDSEQDVLQLLDEVRQFYYSERKDFLAEAFTNEVVNWLKYLGENEDEYISVIFDFAEYLEGLAIEEEPNDKKSSFREAHYLEQAVRIYLDYGNSEKAKELQVRIKNAHGIYTSSEMSSIPFEFGVNIAVLEMVYDLFRGETIEDSFVNFSVNSKYFPSLENVRNSVEERKKNGFLSDMVTRSRFDGDRKIFQEQDYEDKEKFTFYDEYSNNIDENLLSNTVPNYCFFIKFVLVDDLGFNLRNSIAHGLAKLGKFSKYYANIVVYLYFILTLWQWSTSEKTKGDADEE